MLRITTLSKTRRQRVAEQPPRGLDTLPDDWRSLLKRWVRRGGDRRWETLKGDAGVGRQNLAQVLLDWLLENGWVVLTEKFERAEWWPYRMQFQEPAKLRAALGIVDADMAVANWETARSALPPDTPLLDALDTLPPKMALARADLATALARWQLDQRSGTQRDFALFARGTTKAVSEAEWNWLNDAVNLAEWGIERHTPLLLLAAPIALQLPRGELNLAACTGFAALTPATLATAASAKGALACWHLVENRTSFERVARTLAPDAGVIWLPGFPPTWWREAIRHLLTLVPAPAAIACDPDPAGVAIAVQVGTLWHAAGLDWHPWHMEIATLQGLPSLSPLNAWDQMRITQLAQSPLPNSLSTLLAYMLEQNVKGEQEGIL